MVFSKQQFWLDIRFREPVEHGNERNPVRQIGWLGDEKRYRCGNKMTTYTVSWTAPAGSDSKDHKLAKPQCECLAIVRASTGSHRNVSCSFLYFMMSSWGD